MARLFQCSGVSGTPGLPIKMRVANTITLQIDFVLPYNNENNDNEDNNNKDKDNKDYYNEDNGNKVSGTPGVPIKMRVAQ